MGDRQPTEYRVIPHRARSADQMLQFKLVRQVTRKRLFRSPVVETETTWRFVPTELLSYHDELWIYPEWCPTSLFQWSPGALWGYCSDFIGCYVGQDWDIKAFIRRWPHIEDYFARLQAKHEAGKRRDAERNHALANLKTVYLTQEPRS